MTTRRSAARRRLIGRSARHRGAFVLTLAVAGAVLAGCGGSGSGDAAAGPPAGTTFALRDAVIASLEAGASRAATVGGYCNGSAQQIVRPAVPATFEGIAGFAVVTTTNYVLSDCTPSLLSSSVTRYYDGQYALHAVASSDGWYGRAEPPIALPDRVSIGQTANLGRITLYGDPDRSVPIGYDEISFVIEPDTVSTAILDWITRSRASDGSPQETQHERSRLALDGTVRPVSVDLQSDIDPERRLTLDAISDMPAPAPSPAPAPTPIPPTAPPIVLPPEPPPAADTTRPTVITTDPVAGANRVPLRSPIRVDFSEALDPASVSSATFSVRQGDEAVAGLVTHDGRTATFRPQAPLSGDAVYTVTLTTGLADAAGNTLAAERSWSFTTGPASPIRPLRQAVAYQIDHGHSGFAEFGEPLALPSAPTWSVTLPGNASYPLIADGRVFVTTGGLDGGYGTRLHALHADSGTPAWGPIDIPGTYFWSGLAYDQGRIFVLNFGGLLRAFDAATGAAGWSVQLPLQYAFSAPPTAIDGVVYAFGAGSGGSLYSVDAANGRLLWQTATSNAGPSAPAVDGDGVYVTYGCQVDKIDAYTGVRRWIHADGCPGAGQTVAVADGSVFVRSSTAAPDPILDARTGAPTGTLPGGYPSATPALTAQARFHLSAGTLRAVDAATRAVRWSFAGDGRLVSAPLAIDQTVFIGSSSGMLYGLDAQTGTLSWSGSAGAGLLHADDPSGPTTGLAAGEGYLVVPAGRVLSGWRLRP